MSAPAPVAPDDLPVTVSFTRRADPEHAREMTAWMRAGLSMAEGFPGFLGGGWVRPRGGSDEWHMLARFADQGSRWAHGTPRWSGSGGSGRPRGWRR